MKTFNIGDVITCKNNTKFNMRVSKTVNCSVYINDDFKKLQMNHDYTVSEIISFNDDDITERIINKTDELLNSINSINSINKNIEIHFLSKKITLYKTYIVLIMFSKILFN